MSGFSLLSCNFLESLFDSQLLDMRILGPAKEKTGNVWDATGATFEKKPNKYQLLKRRRATARSEEIVQPFCLGTNAKSKLPHMVWRTIDSICDLPFASSESSMFLRCFASLNAPPLFFFPFFHFLSLISSAFCARL